MTEEELEKEVEETAKEIIRIYKLGIYNKAALYRNCRKGYGKNAENIIQRAEELFKEINK